MFGAFAGLPYCKKAGCKKADIKSGRPKGDVRCWFAGTANKLSAELDCRKDRRSLSAYGVEGRRIDPQSSKNCWSDLDGAD